jgi:hypothetical protein
MKRSAVSNLMLATQDGSGWNSARIAAVGV